MNKKPMMFPRDGGGSIELKGGTGGITHMCGLKDFLEIFKVDVTYNVYSPDSLDPERKKPDMLFTVSPVANVGSSNEIVSRLFIQVDKTIKMFPLLDKVNRDDILQKMHECKNHLLKCQDYFERHERKHSEIVALIENKEIKREGGALNPFPQIQDLDIFVQGFLSNAKLALQCLVAVFNLFFGKEIPGAGFHKIGPVIDETFPSGQALKDLLEDNKNILTNLIDLRNFQEHPKHDKRTVITDFKLTAEGIAPPTWFVTGNPPTPIYDGMKALVKFLTEFSETFYLLTLSNAVKPPFEIIWTKLPLDKIDPICPIYYKADIGIQLQEST